MPRLVSRWNVIWGTSVEIPYWWRVTIKIWVVLPIGWKLCGSKNFPYPPHRDLFELLRESVEEVGGEGIEDKSLRTVGHETKLEFPKGVGGKGVKPKDPNREKYAPSLSVSRQHKPCIVVRHAYSSSLTRVYHPLYSAVFLQETCNSCSIDLMLPHSQVKCLKSTVGQITVKRTWYRADSWQKKGQNNHT